MSQLLWLPDSAKELLCVESDEVDSIETMVLVNSSVVNWLNGKLDTGTFTDILLQYDINPSRIDECEALIQGV